MRGAHRSSRCIEPFSLSGFALFFYCYGFGFALFTLIPDFVFSLLYTYFSAPFLYYTLPIQYPPLYRLLHSGFWAFFGLYNAFFFGFLTLKNSPPVKISGGEYIL